MPKESLVAPHLHQAVRARIAVSTSFFMWGLGFSLWFVHIPVVVARLHLDPAILGLALLNVGLGAVLTQTPTGWLVARTGSRPVARLLLLLFLPSFMAPIMAWSVPVLFVATFVLGVTAGAFGVAINTQAAEVERARGQPTMSSIHGFWSLGTLAGASLGSAFLGLGLKSGSGAAGAAVLMFIIAIIATRYYLPTTPQPTPDRVAGKPRIALPGGAVLSLAGLAFLSNSVEGAVNDWSALYLTSVRGLTEAGAASGFLAFSLAMAICRLFGGPMVAWLGEKKTVSFGGLLMAIGLLLVVVSPWAVISPIGFALVAVGAANTIPIMMAAASRAPGAAPSSSIAAIATGALMGFLIGPPIIGFIAHATNLGVALGLLGFAGVAVALGAAVYQWPTRVIAQVDQASSISESGRARK
jgi:predicted MFS family arabinose efflux permease